MKSVFYGWKMLAAVGWLRALAGGFHTYALAILFLPVSRDLNLSRTAASLIFSLSRAEGALEGPFAGYFIDRFGARILMIVGSVIIGAGYLLLSQVYDFATFLLIYIGVISIGFGAGFTHAPGALANHWFFRHRALSLAIVSATMSLGGALFAPLFAAIVNQSGWRVAAIVSGAVFLAAGLPVIRFIYNTPESKGLSPLGAPKTPARGSAPATGAITDAPDSDFSVRQAMRTRSFWLLVAGGFFRMVGYSAVNVHFIPILNWRGVSEQTAAYYLGMMAAFSVPTNIVLGLAGDRWFRPRVLSLSMVLGTVGLLFLLFGGDRTQFLFIPILAVVDSLFAVLWATLGDFYGRRHFASIRGFVAMFTTSGSMLGPVFAGIVYDRSGDYTLAIQVAAVAFALSALSFWLLRRPGRGVR
ncbi:MAG: MFS transporter [Chloroflexi bacterium]|nr:MFS transporter [Chloroflexota bacterium]